MVHFTHWKSTRSFGETLCVFLSFWRASAMSKGFVTAITLKLRNLFARLGLVRCLHWLHVILLKCKAHTVLRNHVFYEWWMLCSCSKYCLSKQMTTMSRPCMQAAFVKSDQALEPRFVQKCFRSLQIWSLTTLLYACALRDCMGN